MPQPPQPGRHGQNWDREELILAFDLYCRTPFARTKANNPDVVYLAGLLNRTPASVARKLGNFGSFDPELKKRQISGLSNAGKLDEEIWREFHSNWAGLVLQADALRLERAARIDADMAPIDAIEFPTGASERTATRKERVHQSFFRAAVLSAYDGTCCITGIALPECLRAGHIVPWARNESFRADPTNGLCLSASFERLYDVGLFTIDSDYRVVMSDRVLAMKDDGTRTHVRGFHGFRISLPVRFRPSQDRLAWHRDNVFI
jgi:putative restriction endonuclease